MRSDFKAPTLVTVAFALLGLAWAGGSPAGAAPDEPAHFVKAYATADGQIVGVRLAADLSDRQSRSAAWFSVSGRSYLLPGRLMPPVSVLCYAFNPDLTAECQGFGDPVHDPDAPVLAFSHVATYNPFPYVVSGLAMQRAKDFSSAVWRGRLASLAVCTIFLALAAVLACRRGPAALTGVVLAVTPAVVFISASLNTSGIEITAAICVWSALLFLACECRRRTLGWSALAIAGTTLALTRPLGAMMLPVMTMTVVVLTGLTPACVVARDKSRGAWACMVSVAAASAVSVAWAHFVIPHPPVDFGVAASSVGGAIRDLPNQARDVIGIFGYNNTTMPLGAYILGLCLLGGLVILGFLLGDGQERLALVVLGLAALVLDLALAVLVEAQIGFGMQARYIMPLVVGLPLLAGHIVQRRSAFLGRKTVGRLVGGICGGVAVLHLVAFLSNAHRYAVGLGGSWAVPWDVRWSPPGGLVVWLGLSMAACLSLLALATTLVRIGAMTQDDSGSPNSGCR